MTEELVEREQRLQRWLARAQIPQTEEQRQNYQRGIGDIRSLAKG